MGTIFCTRAFRAACLLVTTRASATFRGSLAEGTDGESVRRLASLTGSSPPQGAVLLAELDGDAVAAIGIADGQTVAEPVRSTDALLMQLHLERFYIRLVAGVWGL